MKTAERRFFHDGKTNPARASLAKHRAGSYFLMIERLRPVGESVSLR